MQRNVQASALNKLYRPSPGMIQVIPAAPVERSIFISQPR